MSQRVTKQVDPDEDKARAGKDAAAAAAQASAGGASGESVDAASPQAAANSGGEAPVILTKDKDAELRPSTRRVVSLELFRATAIISRRTRGGRRDCRRLAHAPRRAFPFPCLQFPRVTLPSI